MWKPRQYPIYIEGISPRTLDTQAMEKSFHIYSKYVKVWKNWVSQNSLIKVQGAESFDFGYFTNGISEAIEKVLCHTKAFKRLILVKGEIGFFEWFAKKMLVQYKIIDDPLRFDFRKGDLFCWSQPFSQDGKIHSCYDSIVKNVKESDATLFLDMAYFATHKTHLDISLADYAAFSLSKSLGVSGLRAGILFSKNSNPFLQLKKEIGNAGTFQMNQSIQLMKQFETSFGYLQNVDMYRMLGETHNLDKTDTYCFYTTRDTKHKFFQDQFIRKGERIARVPLKWLLCLGIIQHVS